MLGELAAGYLYYVSFAGVTGADRLDASAAAMAREADGVVVGSALVAALADAADPDEAAARAKALLQPLRQALDAA